MTYINEINYTRRLRKSAGKPIALFTRVVEDFNSAANKSKYHSGWGLELKASGLQVQRSSTSFRCNDFRDPVRIGKSA